MYERCSRNVAISEVVKSTVIMVCKPIISSTQEASMEIFKPFLVTNSYPNPCYRVWLIVFRVLK